ncbi:MAG TPA: hypothetical protein VJQ56_02780 [Blastocatellia bacterium]|nr:hypothetical protein [Blastocatellia bacterium]
MRAVTVTLLVVAAVANAIFAAPQVAAGEVDTRPAPAEFERLRIEGNTRVYNLEYRVAEDLYQRMIQLEPGHPAGYVYLANNLWLETLNSSRRLSTSIYTGGSFYAQDAEQDKPDPKRDREFNELIRKAVAASKARLLKNPDDAEALYYQAAALGLRAGYSVSVNRSFRKAIGDANESVKLQKRVVKLDPNYTDAYLSIGLYEYVIDSLPFFWKTLARLAGIKGSKKKGIEYLERVAQQGKYTSDDARVVLIGLYSRENQPERALEMISYLAQKYGKNYLLGVERASLLYRLGRRDEGDNAFRDLLKNESIAREATDLVNYQWGAGLMSAGNPADALERFRAVVKWPRSAKSIVTLSHLEAGRALDLQGKRAEALAEYQTVLKRENVFDSQKLASQYTKTPYQK